LNSHPLDKRLAPLPLHHFLLLDTLVQCEIFIIYSLFKKFNKEKKLQLRRLEPGTYRKVSEASNHSAKWNLAIMCAAHMYIYDYTYKNEKNKKLGRAMALSSAWRAPPLVIALLFHTAMKYSLASSSIYLLSIGIYYWFIWFICNIFPYTLKDRKTEERLWEFRLEYTQ
jgi:hypothetical protein